MLVTVPATVLASVLSFLAGWPSPLEVIAERLMEWTPLPLANLILQYSGSLARPAALLGALAMAMLTGGIAGALQAPFGCSPWQRVAGFLLSGACLAAVFLRLFKPTVTAPAICLIAAFLLLLVLLRSATLSISGRREFLFRSGIILGGTAALVTLFSVRPLFRALTARRLFPYRPPRGLSVSGLTDLVTPTARFYRMDKVLQFPDVGAPDWRLTLDGAVARPFSLDYGALLARSPHHRYVTMECVDNAVGGPMIGTALWTGLPLMDLLRQAGIRGETAVFHAADGYAESVPIGLIDQAGAMIAYGMNGEALRGAHGYPARLLLPGVYGFKSVKWLERIEVVRGSGGGDWQSQGWTAEGEIHTGTRIDVAQRSGPAVLLAGIAFAGTRGVRAVEVRVNGGPWQRATLGRTLSHASWVQWAIRLHGRGVARIEARAVDGAGQAQTGLRHGAYPDGSTGWATVTV